MLRTSKQTNRRTRKSYPRRPTFASDSALLLTLCALQITIFARCTKSAVTLNRRRMSVGVGRIFESSYHGNWCPRCWLFDQSIAVALCPSVRPSVCLSDCLPLCLEIIIITNNTNICKVHNVTNHKWIGNSAHACFVLRYRGVAPVGTRKRTMAVTGWQQVGGRQNNSTARHACRLTEPAGDMRRLTAIGFDTTTR